jgi:hypothetical protein
MTAGSVHLFAACGDRDIRENLMRDFPQAPECIELFGEINQWT